MTVGPHRRQVGRHVPVHLHVLDPEVGGGEGQRLLDEIVEHHVAPLERHLAAECQEAPHNVAGRIGRLADHLSVLLDAIGRLLFQDFARADEHGERVVELVGNAGNELTERGELRGLDHLLLGERQAEFLVLNDLLEPLRRMLRLLEEARVIDGVRGIGGQRVEELQIGLTEDAGAAGRDFLLGEVDHPDDALPDAQRHADEGAAAVARVARLTEARILLDVLDHHRLAHLDDLAGDALTDLHLDRPAARLLEPAPDRDAQGPAIAVEEHDRPDARAHRAHGALEDVGEEVLDTRDAGGHLDHVVEGAELEHEVLETLCRGAQLDEHAPKRLRDLADLIHLAESRHRAGRAPGRRRGRGRPGRRNRGLPEGAAEVSDSSREPPEEDVAEEGDGEGEENAELDLCRLQQAEPPHEVHEDQQWQDGGQREDRACRLTEPHRTVTCFRSTEDEPTLSCLAFS